MDSENFCETSLQQNIQCFIDIYPYVWVQLVSMQRRKSMRARYNMTQQLDAVMSIALQISSVLNPSTSRYTKAPESRDFWFRLFYGVFEKTGIVFLRGDPG
jgi:hypothetical protein